MANSVNFKVRESVTMATPLTVGNGGTGLSTLGSALQVLRVNAGATALEFATISAGSGTVTSIDVSGGTTGMSFTGGPITTSGTITLSGTLDIDNGGTGQTTANNALNALLPSQTGNNTKVLTTDGTNTSWTTASGGGATLSDDTSTNATRYLTFANATSGSFSTAYVSSTKLYFNPSTGTLNATNFNSLSDEQFKTNIRLIENPLDVINSLDGVAFNWIDTGKLSYGVIAQEIELVLPDIVDINNEGIKSVNYNAIIGFLIEAVKELSAKVDMLENQ